MKAITVDQPRVQQGHEIVVASHRHEIARIIPISDRKLRRKIPSRPVIDLLTLDRVKTDPPSIGVQTLLQDRHRR
ncbi:MAG: hypothetical protein C4530_15620 [Desulfobacteraceae bacterium]|nr:MAG: hypothetical protein C4530_15620 [Desulfobacteraceae bacterium]